MKELFLKGISFKEFLHKVSLMDIGDFHAVDELIHFTQDEIKKIRSIDKKINIIAIAEGWCIDCKINLSLLHRIVELNDRFKLSILPLKEENHSKIKEYQEGDRLKIPTFIFTDENFKVLDFWIEAPAMVKKLRFNEDPLHVNYLQGKMLHESTSELLLLLEKVSH